MKLLHFIWTFLKAHTIVSIVIGAVVVTAAVATPITVHWLNEQKPLASEPADKPTLSEQDETNSLRPNDEEIPDINDESDDPTKEVENLQEMDKPQTESETPEPETNTPQNNNVVSNENSETPQNSSGHTEKNEQGGLTIYGPDYDPSKPQAVQTANTSTGISWDGKSVIVYTYSDGSTGTTPQDGASYEVLPGVYGIYTVIRDSAGRDLNSNCDICGKKVGAGTENTCLQYSTPSYCGGCGVLVPAYTCHTCNSPSSITYCQYCGRISGNGLNETCLRYWAVGDHSCVNCGEAVPTNTCHVCTSGCMYCKKPLGTGTNGTCYRDHFSSSNCPSCNVSVEIDTCHSCS